MLMNRRGSKHHQNTMLCTLKSWKTPNMVWHLHTRPPLTTLWVSTVEQSTPKLYQRPAKLKRIYCWMGCPFLSSLVFYYSCVLCLVKTCELLLSCTKTSPMSPCKAEWKSESQAIWWKTLKPSKGNFEKKHLSIVGHCDCVRSLRLTWCLVNTGEIKCKT